jgi:hypothetical protein
LFGTSRTFAFSLASVVLVACGGPTFSSDDAPTDASVLDGPSLDEGLPDTGGGDGSIASACADSARARCQKDDACTGATYNPIHYGDEATCEARTAALCVTSLSAPGTGATPASVEACAQAIPSESCDDFYGVKPVAACATPKGTLANGTPCVTSSQCQSTYCATGAYVVCGQCAAVPQAGDACTYDGDCGDRGGLTCNDLGRCVAYGALDALCDKDTPCGVDLSCVGATTNTQGTCQTGVASGAPCTSAGPHCDPTLNLVCVGTTCAAEPVVAGGQPCGDLNGGLTRCAASGVCVVPPSATPAYEPAIPVPPFDGGFFFDSGTGSSDSGSPPIDAGTDAGGAGDGGTTAKSVCVAAAPDGQPCDITAGPPCLLPAKCVLTSDGGTAGTCRFPDSTTCH